jgi:hypothetical protein
MGYQTVPELRFFGSAAVEAGEERKLSRLSYPK